MADYAAAPSQPIVQGLIYIDLLGNPQFHGVGVAAIFRGAFPGIFILQLDTGTPGSGGLDPNFARTLVTVRGQTVGGLPFTTIDQKAVTYPPLPPGSSISLVRVALTSNGAPVDPAGADGSGCEVVVWNGNAGNPNYQVQIVGQQLADLGGLHS